MILIYIYLVIARYRSNKDHLQIMSRWGCFEVPWRFRLCWLTRICSSMMNASGSDRPLIRAGGSVLEGSFLNSSKELTLKYRHAKEKASAVFQAGLWIMTRNTDIKCHSLIPDSGLHTCECNQILCCRADNKQILLILAEMKGDDSGDGKSLQASLELFDQERHRKMWTC